MCARAETGWPRLLLAVPDGSRARWAQVLTLSDGKIVAMRDYASPRRALRAVGA